MAAESPRIFTRRDLLKGVGIAGAAAAAPAGLLDSGNLAAGRRPADQARAMAAPEAFETLTALESDALEAMVARIIPTDANGPGAREARAAHYIDRALGGALASSRAAYAGGLESLDRYSRASRGKLFAALSADEQDVILTDVEGGTATGFAASSAAFFNMVRTHTIQGTFSDPYYGGNANFVGWDLIGYPGVRTMVTSDDQRMSKAPPPSHKSAYDFEMFTKASARVRPEDGVKDGVKDGAKDGAKERLVSGLKGDVSNGD